MNSDPKFTRRADLEAWVAREAAKAITPRQQLDAIPIIRRVILAHQHLKD